MLTTSVPARIWLLEKRTLCSYRRESEREQRDHPIELRCLCVDVHFCLLTGCLLSSGLSLSERSRQNLAKIRVGTDRREIAWDFAGERA